MTSLLKSGFDILQPVLIRKQRRMLDLDGVGIIFLVYIISYYFSGWEFSRFEIVDEHTKGRNEKEGTVPQGHEDGTDIGYPTRLNTLERDDTI